MGALIIHCRHQVYLSAGRGGKRGRGASENGMDETGFLHFIYFAICVCLSQEMWGDQGGKL